jgi:hypothetical protein
MQFLCLCHYDAAQFAALGPAQFEEIGRICAPRDRALKESGHLVAVGALAMPDQSRTLRADAAGVRVGDGPYAETGEPFGAFFLIEADSLDQAEEVARLHPGTHLGAFCRGGIEIRPIEQLERL